MEHKEVTKEEIKYYKIGEVIVIEDETKPKDANGSLGLVFGDKLNAELNEENNSDLKQRMTNVASLMHEILIDLQERKN